MNKSKLLPSLIKAAFTVVVMGGLTAPLYADDSTTIAAAVTNSVKTANTTTVAAAPQKRLSGAELYSIHCNRCHPERYPTERTAAQWKTVMLHMQVRASIPGKQARLILGYLEENSGR